MDLTETFNGVDMHIHSWTTRLKQASADTSGDSSHLDAAQMSTELGQAKLKLQSCNEVLNRQLGASKRAAASLKAFVEALEKYLKRPVGGQGNFMGIGTGSKVAPKNPQEWQQLTGILKETLNLLESVQETLAETIANSQAGGELTDSALDELAQNRQQEEEMRKRQQEEEEEELRKKREREREEEEERRKKEEKERKKKEEQRRNEEEEREKQKEERRRQEEEERLKREEERREEEERKRKEEEERMRQEEEERKRREEEGRKRQEEEERKRQEEEEKKKREEEKKRQEEEERKRKEEEEKKRQEEEERKQREEEERKRQEEEERKRRKIEEARLKREAGERRKREEEERRQRELEEKRLLQEEERRWSATVIPIRNSTSSFYLESKHGCAIRAPTGGLISDEFQCTAVPELLQADSFPLDEEVAGNAIRLVATGRSELGSNFRGQRVQWFISLPHSAQRVPGRETVLYEYKNDRWNELPTEDIQSDSLPQEYRWVETRIAEPSVTLVPVNRWKANQSILTREGIELTSHTDNRIRLSIPPESYRPITAQIEQAFGARPIDGALIDDLRRSHEVEFDGLVSTSALVTHTSSESKPVNPQLVYTLHLPRNGHHAMGSINKLAIKTEFTIIASIEILPNSKWTCLEKIIGDEVTSKERFLIRSSSLTSRRLLALRVTEEFAMDSLDFVCRSLEKALGTRSACLVVRQSADSRQAMVALPSRQNVLAALNFMASRGFSRVTWEAASTSQDDDELKLTERQLMQIRLSGNIVSDDGDEFQLRFHSQTTNYRVLVLTPKDPYTQVTLPTYRGFVQTFNEAQSAQLKVPIQVDKLESDRVSQPAWKSPFVVKARDAVTQEYLQSLAVEVQDNWGHLAERLGLSVERCSAIRNGSSDPKDQALEMLINWYKGTSLITSKVDVLAKALRTCGHKNLAQELLIENRRLQHEATEAAI